MIGALVLAILTWHRSRASDRSVQSPLLSQLAIQMAAWGAIELALAAFARRGLTDRDVEGVLHLIAVVRLTLLLDFGYAVLGLTLTIAGWTLGKRAGMVGAGVGIVIQGLALALLDARFVRLLTAYS